MGQRYDVAVVGAGIVGVSTALHLLMRGKKVLLIDRREPGMETSYGNAGIIGNTYILPFGFPSRQRILSALRGRDIALRVRYADLPRYTPWLIDFFLKSRMETRLLNSRLLWPLQTASLDEHRALMQGTDAEKYMLTTGRVSLYRREESFAADAVERELACSMNVAFEVMDMEEFRHVEPHLKPVYRKAVRWTASRRINNPGALTAAYAAKFARDGGAVSLAEVRRLERKDDFWVAETQDGRIEAQDIALCAGPWSAELLKPLGYHLPLGFKRGYHRHFSHVGGATLSHAIVDVDPGYVLASMEQGYRLATGVEIAGLHAPPSPEQIDRALPYARQLFPLGDPVDAKAWCGSRPCFTDSLPVIGPASKHKGLWINFGHGHLGLTIGPSSGRLLAEMMTGAKPFCDPHPYRAGRFS